MKKGLNDLFVEYILNSTLEPEMTEVSCSREKEVTIENYRVKKNDVIEFAKSFKNEFDLQELYALEDEFTVELKITNKSFIDELNAMYLSSK